MLSDSGSPRPSARRRAPAPWPASSAPRSMRTSTKADSALGRIDRIVGGKQRERLDRVGLGAAEVAGPLARGGTHAEAARVEQHRASAPGPPRRPRVHTSIARFSRPASAMAVGAAVSATIVAGAASAACCVRTSASSRPSPQAASASAATSIAGLAVVAANTSAIRASRLSSAAVSPRRTSGSSASSRPNVSTLGEPADQAGGGRLELERQPQLAVELAVGGEHRLAGGHRLRQLGGQEARHRDAERRLRALRRTARQPLRLLHVAGRLGHARGRLGRAELEQGRASQRAGASSSSARRRKRTAWSAAPRSPARRAAAVSASNAQRSPAGPAAEEVDGRALAARRVARERARRGEMQLRLLGRGDRVRERLLDDRVHEPRRQRRVQQLGVDQLVDRAAPSRRGRRPRPPRCRPARRRRRGSRARARRRATAGERRRSRADDEAGHRRRAHGGDRAGVEARGLDTALPQGGDELPREQRVAGRRAGARGADLVAHVLAEAGPGPAGRRPPG